MLPNNYKIPSSSGNYMKLKDGPNRFYVLGPAIVGWQYWNLEGKPVRQKERFTEEPYDIKVNKDGQKDRIKHFWAFPVWNYEDNRVQILEITQSSIQGSMKLKIDNRRGDVSKFDFIVTREGEGLGTDYDVDVDSHEPIPGEDNVKAGAKTINLEALYEGGDPFASHTVSEERIPVVEEPVERKVISVEDVPF